MKADSYQGYHMTYHHNWFDHSDSRHPRIRGDQVHIYNNYYDGNSKYGVGSCTGSQVFVENNYFRNVKFPVLISKQGSDVKYTDGGKGTFSGEDGGMIKMFGNVLNGGHDVVDANSEPIEFDAYIAKSREEQVPSTFKAKQGGTTYNNFDTNGLYSYNVDDANYVPDIVMSNAGRIDGGDLKWDFDDAVEDTNDQIIPELNNAVKGYESTLINAAGVTGFYPETTNGTPPTARPTDVPIPTAGPTLKPGETPVPTNTPEPTQAPIMANPTVWDFGMAPFTITDGDAVHPDTNYFPQNAADKERYDLKNTSINLL